MPGPHLQRAGQIAGECLNRFSEGPCILGGLGSACRRVGSNRKRGVPQEADPTNGHSGRLDVHNHLDEWMFGGCNDRGDLVWQRNGGEFLYFAHVPVLNTTWTERDRMREAVAIGHQLVESSALIDVTIPHEVPASVAPVDAAIGAGDRVDKNVTVRDECVRNRVVNSFEHGNRDVSFSDRAPPCHVTSVNGFDAGKQQLAARREDPIREHKKIVPELLPAGETQINSMSVLAKPDERSSLEIALAAELVKKAPVQTAPGDETIGDGFLPKQ